MKNRNCRFGGCGDPTCRTCGGGRGNRNGGRARDAISEVTTIEFANLSAPSGSRFFPGCGNPACPICNKGRDDAPVKKESEPMNDRILKGVLADQEEVMRYFSGPAFNEMRPLDFMAVPFFNPVREEKPKPGAAKPSSEELALRDKVKSYLLETKHQVAWDDVVGNEAARAALLEAIEHPVVYKDLYAHYGRKASKGVLLYGPPGCGKTMFGKAAAAAIARLYGSDDVPLLKINGPEIQTPFVGMTEGIIRDIFAYARAFAKRTGRPLVVFIDEADSLLPSRDGAGGRRATSWEESQVAAFLAEMDGLETSGAFVILATNRPHAIDAAVLRDGRCDRKIKVARPDEEAAGAILAAELAKAPLADDVKAEEMAGAAVASLFHFERQIARIWHSGGMDFLTLGSIVSGAMLVGLIERAKTIAFGRDLRSGARTGLRLADIEAAIEAVFEENRRLDHFAAVEDVAERLGVAIRSVVGIGRAAT